jgi:hypothetical protein
MQINPHEASRIKKRDKCKLVFSRTKKFDGLTLSAISKPQWEKCASDWLKYPGTQAIWEGCKFIIVAYSQLLK